MTSINFVKAELAAAIDRGVRQCVVIGWSSSETLNSVPEQPLQVFAVDEEQQADLPATFVPTQFAYEALGVALEKSEFDKLKATLFIWLGTAGYSTVDAVMASLAFVASLPGGSGVVFDYAVERISSGLLNHTALDALASRISLASGNVKYLIRPQAVTAMLRGLGFRKVLDLVQEGPATGVEHIVSAIV